MSEGGMGKGGREGGSKGGEERRKIDEKGAHEPPEGPQGASNSAL